MGSNTSWESEILDQLDRHAEEYDFPMLNNVYFGNADVRLTAFRSSSEWLILFQEIAVSYKQTSFVNAVSAYGNKLGTPGTQQAVAVISAFPESPMWDYNNNFLLNLYDFEVIIGGRARNFTPSQEDYRVAGIDVESNMETSAKVLRLLTYLIPGELFMQDDQLLGICGKNKSDLRKFLQIEDWCHPDLADDELPSQSICFQSLATAIAENNESLYACSEDGWNTHWSHWELE